MGIAVTLHLLAAIIWVGGMFFAYMALRPTAAEVLQPPERLRLWSGTFSRFFHWVWMAVVLLPCTGYWMLFTYFGGFAGAGWHIHTMQAIGWVMIALFAHLYFAPYRRLRVFVPAGEFPAAAAQLNTIRRIVAINLSLGLITVVLGVGGRYVSM